MSENIIASNPKNIILTTGLYDLIKDHIRRRKVTPQEEAILTLQLKNAKQVLRKDLPQDVITVDTSVTIKNLNTSEEKTYVLVGPDKARRKNNTTSILSKIGLALVGCKEGDLINWELDGTQREVEVLNVKRLS
ncbi:MAG TPA: GreA/GreB family elongation factor [Pelobium sp.]|nr:GreA/GreB family elongation factor [Pelobium sp.]